MKIIDKIIDDVLVLKSDKFQDERGAFVKFFQTNKSLQEFTIKQVNFVQNHQKNTLRGLHYQKSPHSESKFFRVIQGQINVVFFCFDPSMANYRKAASYKLTKPEIGLLVPKGYATGYEVLAPDTEVLYFSDGDYHTNSENGIHWNDTVIKNLWLTEKPIISEKDKKWPIWI